MATKLQWSFPAIYGNTPDTEIYRDPVVLREGEDFDIEGDKIVLREKDGLGKVGVAIFNDRWFADDYEFVDKYENLLKVVCTKGGEING